MEDAEHTSETERCEADTGLDEVQMHLACLPERYMRAKFSLSAYIFCWTVVKLCQVRVLMSNTLLISHKGLIFGSYSSLKDRLQGIVIQHVM